MSQKYPQIIVKEHMGTCYGRLICVLPNSYAETLAPSVMVCSIRSLWDFPGGSVVKNPPASAEAVGALGLILGSGRSPGGGNGNPLQYSCWKIQWTMASYTPKGCKELDMTEHMSTLFLLHLLVRILLQRTPFNNIWLPWSTVCIGNKGLILDSLFKMFKLVSCFPNSL